MKPPLPPVPQTNGINFNLNNGIINSNGMLLKPPQQVRYQINGTDLYKFNTVNFGKNPVTINPGDKFTVIATTSQGGDISQTWGYDDLKSYNGKTIIINYPQTESIDFKFPILVIN